MAEHMAIQEAEDIDYESLGGGSLTSNLLAGAFAGIMVCHCRADEGRYNGADC
jgi:hypothetical protein